MSTGAGGTLDEFFALGKEYIRARYGRTPDPAQSGNQAVAIPAASTVQVTEDDDNDGMSYVPVIVAAVVVVVLLGIALKKAG